MSEYVGQEACIFKLGGILFIKAINTATSKFKKAEEEAGPAVDPQLELLKEIRDLLAKK